MNRFWSKVDKSGDCWNWTAGVDKNGYGTIRVDGSMIKAHRFVLLLEGIDIPSGMCVCHTCDNPGCVNPDHLFIGTHADNMHDMAIKKRVPYGENNYNAKLTKGDVAKIYESDLPRSVLAKNYGLNVTTIRDIKLCLSWQHLNLKGETE